MSNYGNLPTVGERGRIGQWFLNDDAQRQQSLEQARIDAALSKPWILPPKNWDQEQALPETYQTVGARGVHNLEGKYLMGIVPPGTPFIAMEPSAKFLYAPGNDANTIEKYRQLLFGRASIVQAVMETANGNHTDPVGYRTSVRQLISQALVTGDTLARINDNYTQTVFNRTQYVTFRDTSGQVMYHVIYEVIDPIRLGEEMVEKVGLKYAELKEKPVCERMVYIDTAVEWQPVTKTWNITQEVNKTEINKSQEPVSQFISVPFDLSPGDHYGRSMIARHRGALRSLDRIEVCMLDFASASSRMHPCIDQGSSVKPEDLAMPSGHVIEGARVVGGVVQDVGFIKVDKMGDFSVVAHVREALRQELGAAFLIGSEAVRKSERTTAYEVAETTIAELDGAVGGDYSALSDRYMRPAVERHEHMLVKSKALQPLPPGSANTVTLTGIDALARFRKAAALLEIVDVARNLGPEALAELHIGRIVDIAARYRGVNEPGVLKTDEEKQAETQARIAAETQQAAAQQAVESVAAVYEHQATSQ